MAFPFKHLFFIFELLGKNCMLSLPKQVWLLLHFYSS